MRTFTFHVTDSRYSEAMTVSAVARDEERARSLAKFQLEQSPHHVAVNVMEARRLLFTLYRDDPAAPVFQ
jgi:hypothetical protein